MIENCDLLSVLTYVTEAVLLWELEYFIFGLRGDRNLPSKGQLTAVDNIKEANKLLVFSINNFLLLFNYFI